MCSSMVAIIGFVIIDNQIAALVASEQRAALIHQGSILGSLEGCLNRRYQPWKPNNERYQQPVNA